MSNRLKHEHSLYLRQHAENPVDWWPWGEAARKHARDNDLPLLVSIGYSACHWCHVMAHESFENAYIADLMNRHFVNIKIDREERPDIDQIYMEAVQMITRHGGWPLNVFCFPDGRPFFGGTYFPPDDRGHGIVPWPQVLMRVSDYYRSHRDELEQNADAIVKNLLHANNAIAGESAATGGWTPGVLAGAAESICQRHDDEHGGFGEAPKFPPSMSLDFLLAFRNTDACETQRPNLAQRIDAVINGTLRNMARGGIFDQFGGGFARYSVDRFWIIPHFEKMLYDNGLLLDIYAKAYRRYPEPLYARVVDETVRWLLDEMRVEAGAFAAAFDADSDGEEGRFYTWTPDEVRDVLAACPEHHDQIESFLDTYGITEGGNFEHGRSNPVLTSADNDLRERLTPLRRILYAERAKRTWPARDPKQLLAWNALAIRGLAEAAFTFDRKEWLHHAQTVAESLWQAVTANGPNDLKSVVYPGSGPTGTAFLSDYALFIEALLTLSAYADWARPGDSSRWVERSVSLMDALLSRFTDSAAPGFFFTPDDHESLVRKKEWFDNALPSGNSSVIHGLAELSLLHPEPDRYIRELNRHASAYRTFAERASSGVAHALSGLTRHAAGIVVIKAKGVDTLDAARDTIAAMPWRRVFLFSTDEDAQPEGYQFCVGSRCLGPVADPADFSDWL